MKHALVRGFVLTLAVGVALSAAPLVFTTSLAGDAVLTSNEPFWTAFTVVTIDQETHTMAVQMNFTNLLPFPTASHIHVITAPDDMYGTLATPPNFQDFPSGVRTGSYVKSFNTLSPSTYADYFLTLNNGPAGAEMALFSAMTSGRAFLTIHTVADPSGQTRGYLVPVPEPGTLLGVGVVLAGILLRRRRASHGRG